MVMLGTVKSSINKLRNAKKQILIIDFEVILLEEIVKFFGNFFMFLQIRFYCYCKTVSVVELILKNVRLIITKTLTVRNIVHLLASGAYKIHKNDY